MNSTYNETKQITNPNDQHFWKIGQFFVVFNLAISLWAAVSIFKHKARKKQVVSVILARASSVLVIMKVASTQAITIVGRVAIGDASGDVMCEIALDVSGCFYFLCNLSVYVFLWRRQHVFNCQQKIIQTSKLYALLSWFVLFLLVVGGTTLTVVQVAPPSFRSSGVGCVRRPGRMQSLFVIILSQISIQVFIFALFLRPFAVLRRRVAPETSQVSKVTGARLRRAVKSSLVSTGVIVTSDLVSLVITANVLPLSTPRSFVSLFFDVSMVLDVVFVFLTFENSRLRLNPFSRTSLRKTITFVRA